MRLLRLLLQYPLHSPQSWGLQTLVSAAMLLWRVRKAAVIAVIVAAM